MLTTDHLSTTPPDRAPAIRLPRSPREHAASLASAAFEWATIAMFLAFMMACIPSMVVAHVIVEGVSWAAGAARGVWIAAGEWARGRVEVR